MEHAKHQGVNAMRAPYEILGTSENPCVGEVRKAYRALAKRWHPDRFAAGPEREWAGDRMAEINAAYRALMNSARAQASEQNEADKLQRARQMIDDGRLTGARELLMGMPTRCAEWNYLFGALLMKLNDYNKALIYLTVAAHQRPDSAKYASAELAARAAVDKRRRLFR
jgi:DnaJ-class molecular chaperone